MAYNYTNSTTNLTTTNITDVYQCPTGTGAKAIVLSCLVANVDGTSSADITMTITSAGNTATTKIANTIPVPADTTLELIPNKLILQTGQKLRATASAANDLDITVSILEIT